MHEHNQPIQTEQAAAAASPLAGLPSWVTETLIAETQEAWTPVYGYPVTTEEAIEIVQLFGQLTDMLGHG